MSPNEESPKEQAAPEAPAPTADQPNNIEDTSPEPPNEAEELAAEEEAPQPSTVHPSAPAGSSADDEALVAGKEEYGEYFIGMWGTRPNFGCPYCSFSTIEQGGNGLIELHTLAMIESGSLSHMAALQLRGE